MKRQHKPFRNFVFHKSGRGLKPLVGILIEYGAVMFAGLLTAFENGRDEWPQLGERIAGEVNVGKCL